jgi:hypothetical protein
MAKTLVRPPDADLYDKDFPLWAVRLRRPVARELETDRVRSDALPLDCPYTLEQVLDADWYPANVHGIEDPTL